MAKRTRSYRRKARSVTKRSRKYKKSPRRYGRRRKLHEHRLNWLRDKYSVPGQKYRRGALHRHYGIPMGDEIPLKNLVRDQHKPGKLGYQVRFALGRRGYYSK